MRQDSTLVGPIPALPASVAPLRSVSHDSGVEQLVPSSCAKASISVRSLSGVLARSTTCQLCS